MTLTLRIDNFNQLPDGGPVEYSVTQGGFEIGRDPAMDWTLPDEEANTVAGLVIHEAQAIPTVGQVFSFHGFRFEVLARENNHITKLKIMPL